MKYDTGIGHCEVKIAKNLAIRGRNGCCKIYINMKLD